MSIRLVCVGIFVGLMGAVGLAPTLRPASESRAPRAAQPPAEVISAVAIDEMLTPEAVREARLVAEMNSGDRARRSAAIAELGEMNAQLFRNVEVPELGEHALRVLAEVGLENQIPIRSLLKVAQDGTWDGRRRAYAVLRRKNIFSAEVRAALAWMDIDPRPGELQSLSGFLSRQRRPSGPAKAGTWSTPPISELIKCVSDPDPEVRSVACRLLGLNGARREEGSPGMTAVIDSLASALNDRSGKVRYEAVRSLLYLARVLKNNGTRALDPRLVVPLTGALSDLSPSVRGGAMLAFSGYRGRSSTLDTALLKCLRDRELRDDALNILALRGNQDDVPTDALVEIAFNGGTAASRTAHQILSTRIVGGQRADHLLAQLASPDPLIRAIAAAKLWTVNPKRDWFELLRGEAGSNRPLVARILADSPAAVDRLCEMAASNDSDASEILDQVIQHEAAVSGLAQALDSANALVREVAAGALSHFGPKAKAAVPALARHLSDESDIVRLLSAYALEKIGPDARDAIPALQQATQSNDLAVRSAASHALAKIGPKVGRQ